MSLRALLAEAVATARSQPVVSAATLLLAVGMVLAVMLTTGRTVGAQQQVLGSIDAMGTRTITIRADDNAGVTTDVLQRLRALHGIEWAGAFSRATDGTNTAIPGGTAVPTRSVYGPLWPFGLPDRTPDVHGPTGYASTRALAQLGMPDAVGAITLADDRTLSIAGTLDVPAFLAGFEPLVLTPVPDPTGSEPVNVIIIVASSPALVGPVTQAALGVLDSTDSSQVSVQTSEVLAHLRGLVQGQLGALATGILFAVVAITGLLLATVLFALITLRRKDYGRRRALGATRSAIITLVLVQTTMVAALGAGTGLLVAMAVAPLTGDPLPSPTFSGALVVVTISVAAVAALLPAVVASRRDPARELRVP